MGESKKKKKKKKLEDNFLSSENIIEEREEEKMDVSAKKLKVMICIIIVAVFSIIGFFACTKEIPAGYVGVVYSLNGGVEDGVKTQGLKVLPPWKRVTLYSVATQQIYLSADSQEGGELPENFGATCKDGIVDVDLEVSYNIPVENVTNMFNKYAGMSGQDVVDTYIRGKLKTYVNEITSTYSVLDVVMDKKQEINASITTHLFDELQEFGIVIESANIIRATPDAAVQEAITQRSKLAQEVELEKKRAEKIDLEISNNLAQAEGDAAKKLIEAENAAAVEKVHADAEAYANKVKSESITQNLIDMKEAEARVEHGWIEVNTSGESSVIVDSRE